MHLLQYGELVVAGLFLVHEVLGAISIFLKALEGCDGLAVRPLALTPAREAVEPVVDVGLLRQPLPLYDALLVQLPDLSLPLSDELLRRRDLRLQLLARPPGGRVLLDGVDSSARICLEAACPS